MVDLMVGIPKFSYPAKKNAPRPAEEFATIQLQEQYVVGLPVNTVIEEVTDGSTGDVIEVRTRIDAAVRLRFRIVMVETTGLPSIQVANGWTTEAMKELMITTGYGYCSCKPISLEDAKLEKEWEARQGFSVELYTTRRVEQTISTMGEVLEINGIYYKGSEQLDILVNP